MLGAYADAQLSELETDAIVTHLEQKFARGQADFLCLGAQDL